LRQFCGGWQGPFFRCRGSRQGNRREAGHSLRYKHSDSIIDKIARHRYIGPALRRTSPGMGHVTK
jgi:hypothetical protein